MCVENSVGRAAFANVYSKEEYLAKIREGKLTAPF